MVLVWSVGLVKRSPTYKVQPGFVGWAALYQPNVLWIEGSDNLGVECWAGET